MPRGRPPKVKPVEGEQPITDAVVEVVSVDGVAPDDLTALKSQVRDLEAKLAAANASKPISTSGGATGRMGKVSRFKEWEVKSWKDNGDPVKVPVFETVKVPLYRYTIDLPPCGGLECKINGTPFYHGMEVDVDLDTLRTLKELVYRCWQHDANIHGNKEEAFYRQKKMPTISARGMQ
jgi:hypothetical protein